MSTLLPSKISAAARRKPSSTSLRSPPASSSAFAGTSTAAAVANATAAAAVFRSLVFDGSISVCVTLAADELPPNADRSVESFYIQAPRISYFPLLLPQVRKYLLDLVLDESTSASISTDDLWFSCDGAPLRWHWPLGLLYDYHTSHTSLLPSSARPPPSLASYFSTTNGGTIRARTNSNGPAEPAGPLPFRITLHLKEPPQDSLLLGPSLESCRSCFMNMVKEADYVRWGSVKRVTNLRKEQQDNLWEGVIQNDFEKYWSVASKLVPLPSVSSPAATRSVTPLSSSSVTSTPSDGRLPDANLVRSVPMRVYLPEGAPVMQDVVVPLPDGRPATLRSHLTSILPLFFPLHQSPLAHPLVQGVMMPLETELSWLGACLAGADGWVAVVLVLEGR